MSDNTVYVNTKGLDQFLKLLKVKPPVARVGILGDKNLRTSEGVKSNAEIGARHEFGSGKLPIRSFLRAPISDKMQSYLESSNAFDPQALSKVIKTGSLLEWTRKLGILAESIVSDAFATGGFGKWKPSNMARKKVHQTLVETNQLRESITSEVKE